MKSCKILCSLALATITIFGGILSNGQKVFAEEVHRDTNIRNEQVLTKNINFNLKKLGDAKLYISIDGDLLHEVRGDISLTSLDKNAKIVFFIAPKDGYKLDYDKSETKNIVSIKDSKKNLISLTDDIIKDAEDKDCTDIFWFTNKSDFNYNINIATTSNK